MQTLVLQLVTFLLFEQFHFLQRYCQESIQQDKHIINQLNAYACWMWHVSLLCLASRPKENLLGQLDDYCFELKLLYVNDYLGISSSAKSSNGRGLTGFRAASNLPAAITRSATEAGAIH